MYEDNSRDNETGTKSLESSEMQIKEKWIKDSRSNIINENNITKFRDWVSVMARVRFARLKKNLHRGGSIFFGRPLHSVTQPGEMFFVSLLTQNFMYYVIYTLTIDGHPSAFVFNTKKRVMSHMRKMKNCSLHNMQFRRVLIFKTELPIYVSNRFYLGR